MINRLLNKNPIFATELQSNFQEILILNLPKFDNKMIIYSFFDNC